jgi:hypothetical protein
MIDFAELHLDLLYRFWYSVIGRGAIYLASLFRMNVRERDCRMEFPEQTVHNAHDFFHLAKH